jgi:hypothetical protein
MRRIDLALDQRLAVLGKEFGRDAIPASLKLADSRVNAIFASIYNDPYVESAPLGFQISREYDIYAKKAIVTAITLAVRRLTHFGHCC